ncbi:hypothetical protein [Prevotella corporis]|uniref:hypothetical protein n=1 Tax=Prevotella corporis TaxID=28128 RepID=UPI0023F33D03|nr:hypothetical protein [Prevotella corporis]
MIYSLSLNQLINFPMPLVSGCLPTYEQCKGINYPSFDQYLIIMISIQQPSVMRHYASDNQFPALICRNISDRAAKAHLSSSKSSPIALQLISENEEISKLV